MKRLFEANVTLNDFFFNGESFSLYANMSARLLHNIVDIFINLVYSYCHGSLGFGKIAAGLSEIL